MNQCVDCGRRLVSSRCPNSFTMDAYCGDRSSGSLSNELVAEHAKRKRMHTFMGSKHYCGNRLRYTLNLSCVSCRLVYDEDKRRSKGVKPINRENKRLAEAATGETKFTGTPCLTCGRELRYVSKPYRCVHCSNLRNRRVYEIS